MKFFSNTDELYFVSLPMMLQTILAKANQIQVNRVKHKNVLVSLIWQSACTYFVHEYYL